MPKSKRNKQVELSKAQKHGMEGKKKLYEEIRSCVDSYAHIFIFSVNDMRNSKMKSVRNKWRHSRFFIGKNKVMALALGRTPEEEYRTNLHKIGECLRGERGLLFSNQSPEEVLSWFSSYSEGDYARSGNRATETVELQEGPLSQFPHNLEPYLRQLGLPTTLTKGVIHLRQDHTVCKEGDILTPETAKILKLLGYEMAEFYIKIECVWSQDGSFKHLQSEKELIEDTDNLNSMVITESKEKLPGSKTKSLETNFPATDDKMEVSADESDEIEDEETKNQTPSKENIDPVPKVTHIIMAPSLHETVNDQKSLQDLKDNQKTEDNNEDMETLQAGNNLEDFSVQMSDVGECDNEEASEYRSNNLKGFTVQMSDVVEGDNEEATTSNELTNDMQQNIKKENINEDIESSHVGEGLDKGKPEDDTKESHEEEIQDEGKIEDDTKESDDASENCNKTVLGKSLIQSPHLLEKRPKYSPKVTRSVAKKAVKKSATLCNETETAAENTTLKISNVTPAKNSVAEKATTKSTDEVLNAKAKSHKGHGTGESPMERQLRNRSIKIVKNKK